MTEEEEEHLEINILKIIPKNNEIRMVRYMELGNNSFERILQLCNDRTPGKVASIIIISCFYVNLNINGSEMVQ